MGKYSDANLTFTLDSSTYPLQISNLHWNVSQDDLTQLFGDYKGFVSAKLKYDISGRSLGEAVVVYEIEESADAALQFFDKRQFDGMPISVTKLEPRAYSYPKKTKSLHWKSRDKNRSGINARLGPPSGVRSRLGPSVNTRLGPKSVQTAKSEKYVEKEREIISYEQV